MSMVIKTVVYTLKIKFGLHKVNLLETLHGPYKVIYGILMFMNYFSFIINQCLQLLQEIMREIMLVRGMDP